MFASKVKCDDLLKCTPSILHFDKFSYQMPMGVDDDPSDTETTNLEYSWAYPFEAFDKHMKCQMGLSKTPKLGLDLHLTGEALS